MTVSSERGKHNNNHLVNVSSVTKFEDYFHCLFDAFPTRLSGSIVDKKNELALIISCWG